MSDNSVYGLGVLELRSSDVDMKLRLSSEVKFATSGKNDDDASDFATHTHTQGLTGHAFYGNGVWKPWVVKGHGYHLKINLEIASELKLEDETFAQHVAARLKQFKIWENLELDVISIKTGPSDHGATSWLVYVDYSEQGILPEKLRPHKLSSGLPYHQMQPPPGIDVIKVEAFHVKMLLEKPPGVNPLKHGLRKHDDIALEKFENTVFDGERLPHDPDTTDEGQLCFDMIAGFSNYDHFQCSTFPCETSGRQDRDKPTHDSSSAYLTPPSSQEKKDNNLIESVVNPTQHVAISSETIMSSFELGLRYAMCRLPNRKDKVNMVVSNEDFNCLPTVAPALWVPGYHRSLSERALFLPTISHAIANVSGHSSAKLELRVKAWQLSHRYPHRSKENISGTAAPRTDELRDDLAASLWTEMVAEIAGTRNAGQSRRFMDTCAFAHKASTLRVTDDLLDGLAIDDGPVETCDIGEFKDLLDTASDADEESTCDWSVGDLGDVSDACWTEMLSDQVSERWNLEHPSRLDRACAITDRDPEPEGMDLCGVMENGDSGGGCSSGSHREIVDRRDGSDLDHDSRSALYPRTESEESQDEDMLLRGFGDIGANFQILRADMLT